MLGDAENIESIFRTTIAAWNANDWDRMESLYHPDAVVVAPDNWPEAGEFHGWPAIRREYERLKESWEHEHVEVLSAEVTGDTVVCRFHWHGRSRSGLPLDTDGSQAATIRDGRIARVVFYLDPDEAAQIATAEGGA